MSKRLMTAAQEKKVVARYLSGVGAPTLARDHCTNTRTIYNILIRHGAEIRPRDSIPAETRTAIISAVAGGMSLVNASRKFGVNKTTIHLMAKEQGVKVSPLGRRIHTLNDAAFDILTPESEYWTGFIFADGGFYKSERGAPRLVVSAAEKDVSHLNNFRSFLGSTHALVRHNTETAKGGPWYSLSVRSRQICATLMSYGLVPKVGRIPTPQLIASRDFWRGMVDGDGSVGVSCGLAHIRLCGQILLLKTYQQFLKTHHFGNLSITKSNTIWAVVGTAGTAENIIKTLYSDCTIALARKNSRAQQIIAGDLTNSMPYESKPGSENEPA